MSIQTNLKHLEWSITNGDSLLIDPGKAAQLHAQITELIAERDALKAEVEALRQTGQWILHTVSIQTGVGVDALAALSDMLNTPDDSDPTHKPGGLTPLSADMHGNDKPGMG